MIIALTSLLLAAEVDEVAVHARMADGLLEPGSEHSFHVEFVAPDGTSASDSGLPSPFLQLDVPAGVTLTEPRSDEQAISMPFERLMDGRGVDIPFRVDEQLADDASLGIVLTAYLSAGETRRFFRTRLELPVVAGAVAQLGDATNSRWGTNTELFQIGDKVRGLQLPVADGVEPFDLGTLIGKRPVFLTTYRAHW